MPTATRSPALMVRPSPARSLLHLAVALLFIGAAACSGGAAEPRPGDAGGGSGGAGGDEGRGGSGGGAPDGPPRTATGGDAAPDSPFAGDGSSLEASGAAGGTGGGGAGGNQGGQDGGALPSDAGRADGAALPAELPLDSVRMARPELYAAMDTHLEGPTWRAGDLLFAADGPGGGMMRVAADRKLYRYHPGMWAVGSYLLADGTIIWCDGNRKLVQLFRDGKIGIIADEFQGQEIPFCNDVTVDGAGNVYFSDFRSAIYRVTPDGAVTRLGNLEMPNGVEVDPASRYLYFLSAGRVFRTALPVGSAPFAAPESLLTLEAPGDGCAFDAWGNLWIAMYRAGRLAIFSPERRQVIASIGAGGIGATNLTWGGPAHDTIFVTVARSGVYRLAVGARGFAGHPGAPQYRVKRLLDVAPADQLVR